MTEKTTPERHEMPLEGKNGVTLTRYPLHEKDGVGRDLVKMMLQSASPTETWCALVNTRWINGGKFCTFSFRVAGRIIADEVGGTYMDYYCCGPAGHVTRAISNTLSKRGWTHEVC